MSWLVKTTSNFTQGSIIDEINWGVDTNPIGIVLSNPCDIENDKASFILVAALLPAYSIITSSTDYKSLIKNVPENKRISKNQTIKIIKHFEKYIHNKEISRYYFIDPSPVFHSPFLFVDFQLLLTIPESSKNKLKLLAELPSPHREKMIFHFSSYISRIGVERLDDDRTVEIIKELVHPFELSTS